MLKWATMSPALNQLAQLSINRKLGYVDQHVRLRETYRASRIASGRSRDSGTIPTAHANGGFHAAPALPVVFLTDVVGDWCQRTGIEAPSIKGAPDANEGRTSRDRHAST